MSTNQHKTLALQAWRGIFALLVVSSHIQNPYTGMPLFRLGYCGVTFFFILSGFLSATSNTSNIKNWYLRKFWRIYPIHWVALLMALIVFIPIHSVWNADVWWHILLNALLLHAYVPDASVATCFNGPVWFLCTLVLFYAILPLLHKIIAKNNRGGYCVCFAMCTTGLLIAWLADFAIWTKYNPLVRLPECIIGMCMHDFLYKHKMGIILKNKLQQNNWFSTISECLSIAMLFFGFVINHIFPVKISAIYPWIIPMSLLVSVFALSNGYISTLLKNKWLVALGNISMEIYIFHMLIIRIVPSIEYFLGSLPFIVELLIIIIGTAITCCIYRIWIEKKIINRIKNIRIH